jgi:hypothetical protein
MVMASTLEDKTKCPICDSKVNDLDLAQTGISKEALKTLRRHMREETFSLLVQLVDITMRKIDPDKMGVESETKRLIAELQRTVEEVKERITGTAVGKIGEFITIKDLKTISPTDDFSEENAHKGGTDVVAIVKENGEEIGKVAISVKYDLQWGIDFLQQLNKNMQQESTNFGILVTKDFPKQALNDKAYLKESKTGTMVLIVKPEYVSVAYTGYRWAVIAEQKAQHCVKNMKEQLEKRETIAKAVIEWLNGSEFQKTVGNIDQARELCEQTVSVLNSMAKYMTQKIGEAKREQESIQEILKNTKNGVEDLRGKLDAGGIK